MPDPNANSLRSSSEAIRALAAFVAACKSSSLPINLLDSTASLNWSEIVTCQGLASELLECNLDEVPSSMTGALTSATLDLAKTLAKWEATFLEPSMLMFEPDWIQSPSEAFGRAAIPIIGFSRRLRGTPSEALKAVAEIRANRDRIVVISQEAEVLHKSTKEAWNAAAVSRYAVHFHNESQSNKEAADFWLAAMAGLSIFVCFMLLSFFLLAREDAQRTAPIQALYAWQYVGSKVALISFLIFMVIWCGRMYNANRHNQVVNAHRKNALSTFEVFAANANDPTTKDLILRETTQCIFSKQNSGYSSHEPEGLSLNQVLDLIKSVGVGKG